MNLAFVGLGEMGRRMLDDATLVDSPVLGSLAEAEGGTLKLFVGGDDAMPAGLEDDDYSVVLREIMSRHENAGS